MFVVNRVPNCRAVIRNRIYGFMKRLVSSSNALVLSTVTSDARFRSRIVRHWLKSLYMSLPHHIGIISHVRDISNSIGDIFNSVNKCENDVPYFYAYVGSKQNVRDKVGPLEDNAGNIITQGFLMAEELNMHFSPVFTREDTSSRPVPETTFKGSEGERLGQLVVTP